MQPMRYSVKSPHECDVNAIIRADKYRLVAEEKPEGTLSFSDLAKDAYALPARLLDLLARSEQLYERIMRLDRSLYGTIAAQTGNTVADQINRLEAAFKR